MNKLEIKNLNMKLEEDNLVDRTKSALSKIWDDNEANFKYIIGLRLYQYAYGKHYDYTTKILPDDDVKRNIIISSYRKTNVSSSMAKQFQRLAFGYDGLTMQLTPKRLNISSKAANLEVMKKNTVSDHIIGATLCSEYIKLIFREGKKDKDIDWKKMDWLEERIKFMCNDWLQDNLWLWAQCRITKKEHNPKDGGVKRKWTKDTVLEEIEYRVNFMHYKDITQTIVICDYK
jgi:hypothetical protein